MAVHLITENVKNRSSIAHLLRPNYKPAFSSLDSNDFRCEENESIIVAVDLRSVENIEKLRSIEMRLRRAKTRIFILDWISRLHVVQACSLGATKVLYRPSALDLARELADKTDPDLQPKNLSRKAAFMGAVTMEDIFSSVRAGSRVDVTATERVGASIIDAIEEQGLTNWLQVVRKHHEGTYQHCLLVTGVSVAFGLHLGLPRRDVSRLYSAAMLHDLGKASIPIAILDKPGRLDDEERATIETHPVIGYDILRNVSGVTTETLDSVRHHHEFLDGSGYPDRLCGESIGDLVRMLTISDIFAALIEKRSYRPPMPRDTAYEILRNMDGKLEKPLVAAFGEVALRR